MLEFERLRNAYDIVANPKRYRNDDETVNVQETADPNTWRDETQPTFRKRLASRKRLVILFGYIGLLVLLIVATLSHRFVPELTGNPWVKEGVKWAVAVPLVFWIGTRSIRSKLEAVDWLILLKVKASDQTADGNVASGESAGGIGFYLGNRTTDADGNTVFEPLKGFSLFGLKGHPLTLGDLGDDFARQWSKQGRSADETAVIRLEDGLYSTRETFIGNLTAVLTAGLELDEYGKNSDLYTKEPPLIDPDRYVKLADSLSDYRRQNRKLEEEMDDLVDQKEDWKQQAKKKRKEIRREIIETHGELAEAGFEPKKSTQRTQQPVGQQALDNGGSQ